MCVNTEAEITACKRMTDCSVCFKKIPNSLCEGVFLAELMTCQGRVPLGHFGVIGVAVKHTYEYKDGGVHDWMFEGMVYMTFASHEIATFC